MLAHSLPVMRKTEEQALEKVDVLKQELVFTRRAFVHLHIHASVSFGCEGQYYSHYKLIENKNTPDSLRVYLYCLRFYLTSN